ncbi:MULTISPECIES: dihydroxy-acid dehydratase domain-containing protein [unclassified Oceanobacillus]|uniref:dihydroxy-acid dehydratase domain-containing protein n=1 Tax=unclassified Oceanobacillus TaxID=2630292 RepID=UPI00300DDFF5
MPESLTCRLFLTSQNKVENQQKSTYNPIVDVTEDHIIVLQNAGPKGGPGMPECGMLPIPKKLIKKGVRL